MIMKQQQQDDNLGNESCHTIPRETPTRDDRYKADNIIMNNNNSKQSKQHITKNYKKPENDEQHEADDGMVRIASRRQ